MSPPELSIRHLTGAIFAVGIVLTFGACNGTKPTASRVGTSGSPTQAANLYGKPGPVPSPTTTIPPATRECSNGDLQLVATWPAAYNGDVAQAAEFQNVSASSCYLPDAPTVQLHLSSGDSETAPPARNVSRRVDIPNTAYLFFAVDAPERCQSSPVASIDIDFPGGAVTLNGKMEVACSPQLLMLDETPTRISVPTG